MSKPIVLVLALLVLGGCGLTRTGDTVRDYVAIKGAALADQSLANSEWGVCTGTTMGAVMRRYGQSSERMKAYVDFCFPKQHTPFDARLDEVVPPTIEPFPAPPE